MPAFNEEATVERAMERVLATDFPIEFELLVIENGSTDGTRARLDRQWPASVRVIELNRNIGKGGAIQLGLAEATGSVVAILDADLEYDASDIPKLLKPVLAGDAQAVIGTRTFRSESSYGFWYVLGGRTVTMIANALFNAWISDITSCLKVVSTELLRSLDLREPGFGIDAEIPARLLREGVRIHELPVAYRSRSREQGKKLRARDALIMLRTLIRTRFDGRSPAH
jgi:glycosyltransferase involved in cell wall biosynthesis